jgi:hypothetical protein
MLSRDRREAPQQEEPEAHVVGPRRKSAMDERRGRREKVTMQQIVDHQHPHAR